MTALVIERSLSRFALARAVDALGGTPASGPSPLRLVGTDSPPLPGAGWHHVRPVLSGICGSDLTTLSGRSSRWFEPVVSFPFVPGHEVVGVSEELGRVVVEPVLGCVARGLEPICEACAEGRLGSCQHLHEGSIGAGLQTGYCTDTGGGWSTGMVAHRSQLHAVPDSVSDEEAVMVEPTACAVHAALSHSPSEGDVVVVLGSGTLGLATVAAIRQLALPSMLVASAKYPHQADLARDLGADAVAATTELRRLVRRTTRSHDFKGRLSSGADTVIDCVGSSSSLEQAMSVVRPGGRIVMAGMPRTMRIDLAPLWQREIQLVGAYTYGKETLASGERRTFDIALELVSSAGLGRLVSARYPLERYEEALAHAHDAGRRGAVKIVFEPAARRAARLGR